VTLSPHPNTLRTPNEVLTWFRANGILQAGAVRTVLVAAWLTHCCTKTYPVGADKPTKPRLHCT